MKAEPKTAKEWFDRGVELAKKEQWPEALECFEKATELKPAWAEAWYNLGVSLSKLNRLEEAVSAYKKSLELKPDLVEAWYNLGNALGKLNCPEEAVSAYKKSLESKPDKAEAWYNLGCTLGKLNRREEAVSAYKKSLELKPDDADAWNNLGVLLSKLNRPEEAVSACKKSLELEPDDADAWNNLGVSLSKLNRREEALECYKKAIDYFDIKKDPEGAYPRPWYNQGGLLTDLNRYKEALLCLGKALKLNPDYAWVYVRRGELYLKLGLAEKARAELEAALKLEDRFFDLYILQGRVELERKNYSEALAAFREAVAEEPENCPARLWAVYARYIAAEFAVNKEPALKKEAANVLKCGQENLCRLVKQTAFREEITHLQRELENICQAANGAIRDYANYLSGYLYYRLGDYSSAIEKLQCAKNISFAEDLKYWKDWHNNLQLWWKIDENKYCGDLKAKARQIHDLKKGKYGIKQQAKQLLYYLYNKSNPIFYNWWFCSPVNRRRRFLGGTILFVISVFLLTYPLFKANWVSLISSVFHLQLNEEILNNPILYSLIMIVILVIWLIPTASRMKMKDLEFELASPPPVELSPARMETMLGGLKID